MLSTSGTRLSQVHLQQQNHAECAIDFARQAKHVGLDIHDIERSSSSYNVIKPNFVTPRNSSIKTPHGGQLTPVPVHEAIELKKLSDLMAGKDPRGHSPIPVASRESKDGELHGTGRRSPIDISKASDRGESDSNYNSKMDPLFPPLPMWGPPTLPRMLQAYFFRISASILSFCFLAVIVLGAVFTGIPVAAQRLWAMVRFKDPYSSRLFNEQEKRRKMARKIADKEWGKKVSRGRSDISVSIDHGRVIREQDEAKEDDYVPTEGGPDRLVCDCGYYARRVGLDVEEFKVQTEDGFIISLLHVYSPWEYTPKSHEARQARSPDLFLPNETPSRGAEKRFDAGCSRYPVLLMPGLLQSAGAYCCTDDDSLAFYLAKAGYDVWLGNNRCGLNPEHTLLNYGDPRMWSWNIRQMGVFDLPALISRVLHETRFSKLGLVAHSQGTTETFVALAKQQQPEIGEKISVFCALAPAVYAGPLIERTYLKFMQVISPRMFRLIFGVHSFIPFMMTMHSYLPRRYYGAIGYRVFSFLFDWTDARWDRGLRNRFFQFSPVYVSSESMRWWLGGESFAKYKCILSTCAQRKLEDEEDEEEESEAKLTQNGMFIDGEFHCPRKTHEHRDRGKSSWYDSRAPPFAFWIAGRDKLVDGRRLLRRFERGREPNVRLVHQKIIGDYEHLDVIWALDSIELVGREVKEVLWMTMPEGAREVCRKIEGCEGLRVDDFVAEVYDR